MTIPETSVRPDWPRRVAQAVNKLLRGSQGFERLLTPPGEPFEGQAYYDLTDSKAKVWDGSVWNDLW